MPGPSRTAADPPAAAPITAPEEDAPLLTEKRLLLLSGAAFVTGAVGAALYGLKRRPFAQHIAWDDVAAPTTTPSTGTAPRASPMAVLAKRHPASTPGSPHAMTAADTHDEPPKSALALFREMNSMIFTSLREKKKTPLPVKAVPVSRAHTAPVSASIGALSRHVPAGPAAALRGTTAAKPDEAEDEADDSATMAIKAFSVATGIVGTGALVAALIIRYTLGVKTLQEFTDKMHELMPSVGRQSSMARYIPAVPLPASEEAVTQPARELSHDELIHRLDHTDDPLEWLRIARAQLDAELAAHEARREARRRQRIVATES
ncbi:hypothetical protein ACI68E_004366 [Malassezia pachydermatis]|uniref:Transmembrane protein n=1 Tax=Malassezia pachydermatis TaxID=77020 RepID=A0A0M9VP36_9BASI|nr:hypothetical protein Malapachy_1848 [Malassezia pachydermatis]KOS13832.1 hypothetical protein Malapachy_1848 [Malassezia pachydermatis]